jgi:hypothetical protein
MENILQMEDTVKGMPDEMLMQQAQAPDGNIPQFLLLSEVGRRKDMRQRADAAKGPSTTVAEDLLGIAAHQQQQRPPQQQVQMPTAMQPQNGLAAMKPPGFRWGGIVGYAEGGMTSELEEVFKRLSGVESPVANWDVPDRKADYSGLETIADYVPTEGISNNFDYAPAVEAARARGIQGLADTKKDALSQALIGIGSGIAGSGTPQAWAKAMNASGQQAVDTMRKGRNMADAQQMHADKLGLEGQAANQRVATMQSQIDMHNSAQQNQFNAEQAKFRAVQKEQIRSAVFKDRGLDWDKLSMQNKFKLEAASALVDKAYKDGALRVELEKAKSQQETNRMMGVIRSMDSLMFNEMVSAAHQALLKELGVDSTNKAQSEKLYSRAVNEVISTLASPMAAGAVPSRGAGSPGALDVKDVDTLLAKPMANLR